MTRMGRPTAVVALFLPMRPVSRQNWAARWPSRLRDAAEAHWLRISPSHRSPWGSCGVSFPAGDVVAWTHPRPGGEVSGSREPGHVHADLGDDALDGPLVRPR
jgi:hypothetical protein